MSDGPLLGWSILRPLTEQESALLHQVARFAAAPLAALATRSTSQHCSKLISADAARRRCWRAAAATDRRDHPRGLLYGDLRDFTAMSERWRGGGGRRLDAWFDRIAGAVHAFGGEVLKFIGDGCLRFSDRRAVAFRRLRRRAQRRRRRRAA